MPEIEYSYYFWAILLVFTAGAAWTTNFIALPGNWFIVGLAALFASTLKTGDAAHGLNWEAVALLAVLAAGGEPGTALVRHVAQGADPGELGISVARHLRDALPS